MQDLQQLLNRHSKTPLKGNCGRLHEPRSGVEARQAMARARHDGEDLGSGVDGIEDLREEEQPQGLAEVAEDAVNGEHHAGKVAVRVSNKHLGRVPIVAQERERHGHERKQEVDGEEMRVCGGVRVWRGREEVENIVDHD